MLCRNHRYIFCLDTTTLTWWWIYYYYIITNINFFFIMIVVKYFYYYYYCTIIKLCICCFIIDHHYGIHFCFLVCSSIDSINYYLKIPLFLSFSCIMIECNFSLLQRRMENALHLLIECNFFSLLQRRMENALHLLHDHNNRQDYGFYDSCRCKPPIINFLKK
jgi:hypothetical protein